jgi:hypothetical protein
MTGPHTVPATAHTGPASIPAPAPIAALASRASHMACGRFSHFTSALSGRNAASGKSVLRARIALCPHSARGVAIPTPRAVCGYESA